MSEESMAALLAASQPPLLLRPRLPLLPPALVLVQAAGCPQPSASTALSAPVPLAAGSGGGVRARLLAPAAAAAVGASPCMGWSATCCEASSANGEAGRPMAWALLLLVLVVVVPLAAALGLGARTLLLLALLQAA
jgi:MYXO-CTERM domain-containing protein